MEIAIFKNTGTAIIDTWTHHLDTALRTILCNIKNSTIPATLTTHFIHFYSVLAFYDSRRLHVLLYYCDFWHSALYICGAELMTTLTLLFY